MASRTFDKDNIDGQFQLFTQPMATDEDEITEPAGKNRFRNDQVVHELKVKWQIPGKSDPLLAKKQLYQSLSTLLVALPNRVTLIDRKQREWSYEEKDDSEKFEKEIEQAAIQLHPIKNKQQQVARWVSIIKFRSEGGIAEWKDNEQFYSFISDIGIYLFPHPFEVEEWDVVSIGFLKEVHAIHYPKDELQEHLGQMITEDNPTVKLPKFQLIPQRVTTADKKASTKAFIVQCLKSDAKQLIQLLTTGVFRNPPNQIFVPFKYKTTKPEVFLQCIRQQNDIYYKTWVIKVEGLTKHAMEYMRPEILNINGAFQVVSTKRTNDVGEWKIMVDQKKCSYIHRTLTSIWSDLVSKIPDQILATAPDKFSSPRISSKKVRDYQDTDSDADSYGSLLTTGTEVSQMTMEETILNELPESYRVPSYADAVLASTTSLGSTHISSPTTSAYTDWQKEKQDLEAQLKQQALLIEKIQADLQEKMSRSHDLEEQLAQAIELAYSRDARHEEMLEKFELLMQRQDQNIPRVHEQHQSTSARLPHTSESPPMKKANTNASPNRHVYPVFKQLPGKPPARQLHMGQRHHSTDRNLTTASLQHMDTDEDQPMPPPGVKTGKKIE